MNDALVGVPYVEEVDACRACGLARLDDEGAPPGMRVSSPRPGNVSTMWSIVQKTRDGSATGRPDSRRLLRAMDPVRSCRKIRSMATSASPLPRSRTTCPSQIFWNSDRGPVGLPGLLTRVFYFPPHVSGGWFNDRRNA